MNLKFCDIRSMAVWWKKDRFLNILVVRSQFLVRPNERAEYGYSLHRGWYEEADDKYEPIGGGLPGL